MTRSTLEGVADLTQQLIALGKMDDGHDLKLAVRAGMKPALDQAKATIPVSSKPHRLSKTYGSQLVNSGFARSNIVVITTLNGDKNIASAILGVKAAAFYAVRFVELGTRKMAPHPWLRRSLLDKRDACEEAFKASMQRSVDRAVKAQ